MVKHKIAKIVLIVFVFLTAFSGFSQQAYGKNNNKDVGSNFTGGSGGGTTITSSSFTSTNGDFIVGTFQCDNTISSITDSQGNTWTKQVGYTLDGGGGVTWNNEIWTTTLTAGGTMTITITVGATSTTCEYGEQQFNTDSKTYSITGSTAIVIQSSSTTTKLYGARNILQELYYIPSNALIVSVFFHNHKSNSFTGGATTGFARFEFYNTYGTGTTQRTCSAGECYYAVGWGYSRSNVGLTSFGMIYENTTECSTPGPTNCLVGNTAQNRYAWIYYNAIFLARPACFSLNLGHLGVDECMGFDDSVTLTCTGPAVCGYTSLAQFSGNITQIDFRLASASTANIYVVIYLGSTSTPTTSFNLAYHKQLPTGASSGVTQRITTTPTAVSAGQAVFVGIWIPASVAPNTVVFSTAPNQDAQTWWTGSITTGTTPSSSLPSMSDGGQQRAILYAAMNARPPRVVPSIVTSSGTIEFKDAFQYSQFQLQLIYWFLFLVLPLAILTALLREVGLIFGIAFGIFLGTTYNFLTLTSIFLLFLVLIVTVFILIKGGINISTSLRKEDDAVNED